jgi:hypothetical protein
LASVGRHRGGGLDRLDPDGGILLVRVAGAGRIVLGPEQEADAITADGQGMEHRVAAGVGGEGGELAGDQEGRGEERDKEGAERVPVTHDASGAGAESISHGLRLARSTCFRQRCG